MKNKTLREVITAFFARNKVNALSKLIIINCVLHVLFAFLISFERGYGGDFFSTIKNGLTAPGNASELMYKVWSPFTYMFLHADFMHLIYNMLMFYLSGILFLKYFSDKRLYTIYILGGLSSYLLHLLSFYIIPNDLTQNPGIIGASGSIMAVFIAIAIYRPLEKFDLYGMVKVPIILLAIFYVGSDILDANSNDNVAHFGHLGGALFGVLAMIGVNQKNYWLTRFEKWISNFRAKRMYQSFRTQSANTISNYNRRKKERELKRIIEKVAKTGYDGLTKREKDIFFNSR